ncbi:MAG: asparagine synthase B [Labilithrix sp.]|nr:asparagine synthase B [Labilithrix sp.]
MCGFTAYVGAGGDRRLEEVRRMAALLSHRGPDDADARAAGHAALAHRRLSIIDVAGGRQPLSNEDGSASLVCNGEIYNFHALRSQLRDDHRFATASDSEVILHLYEERGAACVRELDGMFAFVLTDGHRFLAARDALGIKPLYFGRDRDGVGLWFASELKALPVDCREIAEFPPGTLMTEDGMTRWFEPPWREPARDPEPVDATAIRAELERAVAKRLMSDVPLGVFLSGGLDSSAIAALVRRVIPNLRSFAVGLDGSPDLLAARRAAAHIGTHHHEYVYTRAEAEAAVEPVIAHLESYDAALIESAVPCWFVSKLAAEHVKVVLSGEGADEVFAGYGYFADIRDPSALHAECSRLLLGLHNMNLQRVDRMTMAHALEGRVPFLDLAFVARAMRQDPALKTTQERPEKWLLRRAVSDLLPPEIVWRTKQEFAHGSGAAAALSAHAEREVTDADFARRRELFPEDTPTTKQAFAYRRIFEERFPGEERRRTVGRWRGHAHAATHETS